MFASRAARLARARPLTAATIIRPLMATPSFHTRAALRKDNGNNSNSKKPAAAEEEAAPGSYARTDETITVEYPAEHELPSSKPVVGAGRADMHVFPTLPNFSLEGNVGVVTGGARGLGLVMGQGMVVSGADLAIVDLNSEWQRISC
jgi:D-arabinitol 2-dehydrogenase